MKTGRPTKYETDEAKREAKAERMTNLHKKYNAETSGVYKLTDEEKTRLGLKQPPVLKGTIHIVVPEHYGASGLIYSDRFVTPQALPGWLKAYPGAKVI